MEPELRLKALARLATSGTAAAADALKNAMEQALESLHNETEYDLLEQSLSVLEIIAHRFPDVVTTEMIAFIANIKARQITYDKKLAAFVANVATYQNASTLAVKAIEVLLQVRYLATRTVTQTLLTLSLDSDERVSKEAVDGLKKVTAFDLRVFYGDDKQPGIGAQPQKDVVDLLTALRDEELIRLRGAVLEVADSLLSPTIEGTRWSSTALTISQGALPPDGGVADIRRLTIQLLKRLYALVPGSPQKLSVIQVLNNATRPHHIPTGGANAAAMIAESTQAVLDFYKGIADTADFQTIQKIESLSYWIYYHAPNDDVKREALAIERAISTNTEYAIYKTLIGFEGIFISWEDLRRNDGHWEETDNFRRSKAKEFATGITAENFPMWRSRILSYARTESQDLATFPIFYYFLETFAVAQPKLALKLLAEDTVEIAGFHIPLLRGIWAGPEQAGLRALMDAWIAEGKYLYAIAKQFLDCPTLDRALVKRLLGRANELNDLHTVAMVMTVAASNYRDDDSIIRDLFLPALEILTERGSPQWIFDMWYRREARAVISKLDEQGTDLVLSSMMPLEKIDHHAEELLYLIAQRMPQKVMRFLCQRLSSETSEGNRRKTYDAIPYRLHKLDKPLAAIPKEAVRIVREQYDGDFGMFIFRGAHLLKTIFPQFSAEFESELLRLVHDGDDADLEFVLAVLRNYEGQPFIHGVSKAIVEKIPADSQFRTEVAVALQNTGVVSGAYGFSDAYERKIGEIQDWLNDPRTKVREFATWYVEGLKQMSAADRQRADEEIALRKQRFGE